MRIAAVALAVLGIVLPVAAADDVTFVEKKEDVEYCKPLGEVKARSGWGGSAGCARGIASVRETLAKRAAALGANFVLLDDVDCGAMGATGSGQAFSCDVEALEKQKAKREQLNAEATKEIRCEAGSDCEMKWSRVTQWLLDNSDWKLRNVTDALITTEGPMDTAKPAYEVVKMPSGDGKTYLIRMRAGCGEGHDCTQLVLQKKISFGAFVRGETQAAQQ